MDGPVLLVNFESDVSASSFLRNTTFIGKGLCTRYCYCYSYCYARFPFMHGKRFGCYFSIGMNQDVDGPVLLDPFLSLMAQYYRLFPEKDSLHWLQPGILSCRPSHKINSLFSFCESLRTTCLHPFFLCWVGIRG